MKKLLSLLPLAAVLAACTADRLPKPQTLPQLNGGSGWFRLEERDAGGQPVRQSLLAVEQGADEIRFVQTDALGAPLSRQILDKQGWRNDGFIMPNAVSRRVFGAMLPILAKDARAVYPQLRQIPSDEGECYGQHSKKLWCTTRSGGGYLITFPDRTQWAVTPIQE